MRICVISDLHLGGKDTPDQFQHDTHTFLKFLKYLEDNFEKIILNGDIWETLMPRCLGKQKHALFDCFENHKSIYDKFSKNDKYIYISGNHDNISSSILGTPDHYVIQADDQKIFFTHGHKSDLLQGNLQWVSELGVWLGGWILRADFKQIYSYLHQLDIRNSFDNHSTGKIQKGINKLLGNNDADINCFGHTHIGSVMEYNNKMFMNSGTCSYGKFSFLSIDTKANQYHLNTTW